MSKLETAAPNIVDATVQPQGAGADTVLVVRGCRHRGTPWWDGVIPASERIVDLAPAALIQYANTGFQISIEAVPQTQRQGAVTIGIIICVAGIGCAGAVDAGCFFQPGGQVETGTLVAAGEAQGTFPGAVTATSNAYVGVQAFAFATTGENLDYPAHGIGPVDGGTRAA